MQTRPHSGSLNPELSVVVLAWNEGVHLVACCTDIILAARSLRVPVEVLLIDDGSTDDTGQLCDRLATDFPEARPIHHGQNLGLGGGYRTGMQQARGTFVTFFPADGQFPPEQILPPFFAEMRAGADLVLGHVPDRKSSWVAKALSGVERALYKAMFGRFPRFQGIFMVRRSVLEHVPLVSQGRGWAVVMELILRISRGPYKVVELPHPLRARVSGQSKVNNWRTIWANFRQLGPLWKELGRH